jgi:hypothetical protein
MASMRYAFKSGLVWRGIGGLHCRARSQRAGAELHSTIHSKELKHDCVTRLDRDRAAGVNHAWNSWHRCRARSPAVAVAYLQSITVLHARPPLPATVVRCGTTSTREAEENWRY